MWWHWNAPQLFCSDDFIGREFRNSKNNFTATLLYEGAATRPGRCPLAGLEWKVTRWLIVFDYKIKQPLENRLFSLKRQKGSRRNVRSDDLNWQTEVKESILCGTNYVITLKALIFHLMGILPHAMSKKRKKESTSKKQFISLDPTETWQWHFLTCLHLISPSSFFSLIFDDSNSSVLSAIRASRCCPDPPMYCHSVFIASRLIHHWWNC